MRTLAISALAVVTLGGCISGPPPVRDAAVPSTAEAAVVARTAVPPPPVVPVPRPAPAAPRIDNASLASFRSSWQKMSDSLSASDRTKLNRAAALIAFAPYGAASVPLSLKDSPIVPEVIRDQIHGMTFAQIVRLGAEHAAISAP
jgi:hypothetical protein